MSKPILCPQCKSEYTYENGNLYACSQCFFEWDPATIVDEDQLIVLDANGNPLEDGDTIIVIKDLPVKGAPKPIKAGTKVKNIRLTDSDHNISCRIDGFGSMALKSEFVKKG